MSMFANGSIDMAALQAQLMPKDGDIHVLYFSPSGTNPADEINLVLQCMRNSGYRIHTVRTNKPAPACTIIYD